MAASEILASFGDQIKKGRNPFFGTFIIVWIVRNWQLIVTLFNLDLFKTMQEKITALQSYFVDGTIVRGFFINSAITLGVMVVTYVILNFARWISDVFEKRLSPWVHRLNDKGSIVLKSDYDQLFAENSALRTRLAEEREKRVKAEQERDEIETKRIQNTARRSSRETTSQTDNASTLEYLKGSGLWDLWVIVMDRIGNDQQLTRKDAKPFIDAGLISLEKHEGDKGTYHLTESGIRLRKYLISVGEYTQKKRTIFDTLKENPNL